MSKVKILVVEDEVLIADNICDTLEDLGYNALEPAINFTEAIETIEREHPDLAILDIQLSGQKTGIDLAKEIKDNYKFPFIFLTSNADKITLDEAKKVNPSAYLVKPFSKEELLTTIEVALYNFAEENKVRESVEVKDALFLKEKGVFTKINFDDIYYIKSDHVYLEIFMVNNKKSVVRGSLNGMVLKLTDSFMRVHRGYIINLQHLQQIEKSSLIVNNEAIPIGKKHKQEILDKIKSL